MRRFACLCLLLATGELQLTATRKFTYHLTTNPRAAVHASRLLRMTFRAST